MMRPAGWAVRRILLAIGMASMPREYVDAVIALRRLRCKRRVWARYVRPIDKRPGTASAHKRGLYIKVPKEERLVPEENDPWRHLEYSMSLSFPNKHDERREQPYHKEAAWRLVEERKDLETKRERYIDEWEAAVAPLDHLDKRIRACTPRLIEPIMRRSRLATMAAAIEAVEWDDVDLAFDLFTGMNAAGSGFDGDPEPRSSLVYKDEVQPAAYSLDALHRGEAHESEWIWEDGELKQSEQGGELKSSAAWFQELQQEVPRKARDVLRASGIGVREVQAVMNGSKEQQGAATSKLLDRVEDEQERERLHKLILLETKSIK